MDLRNLLIGDTPFLDVRAEIEFEKGTIPNASNFPILQTQERHDVGVCYKEKGQDEAIKLGHQLVGGDVKQQRLEYWRDFIQSNPSAHLYCWRGGMRSHLCQQWLGEMGVDIPLVPGGYKALRRVLIDELTLASTESEIIIVAGKTGVAKTKLINRWEMGVDLEGFANHRGSSFGRHVIEPPCQVDFENNLAVKVLKLRDSYPHRKLLIEDESRMVGPVTVPLPLWDAMTESSLAVVEMPIDYRVQQILEEYVIGMAVEYEEADKENGFENYKDYLLNSLQRIKKRLGHERYVYLNSIMENALNQQQSSNTVSGHEEWITLLLEQYYDPMYEYQLEKKKHRIVFTGSHDEVFEWGASL